METKLTTQTIVRPLCPECQTPMHKAGRGWSGRHKIQRWQCQACGRFKTGINGNGHNHNSSTLQSTKQVTMPRAGGEDSFKDKPPRICPVNLKPDANPQGCAFHNGGKCDRLTYPYGCRLHLTKEDWEALPTS